MLENKKEQMTNGWWIPTNPYDCKDYRYTPLTEVNNSYRFKVYLCPTCNKAHETIWEYGQGNQTYFYDDFPTIGLHRAECKFCGN